MLVSSLKDLVRLTRSVLDLTSEQGFVWVTYRGRYNKVVVSAELSNRGVRSSCTSKKSGMNQKVYCRIFFLLISQRYYYLSCIPSFARTKTGLDYTSVPL